MPAAGKTLPTPFSWTEGVTIVLLALLFWMFLFAAKTSCMCDRGHIIDSVNNCRNIVQAIKIYASDNAGAYPDSTVPDARDSNTVFRQLVIDQKVDSEKMFGAGVSKFRPDGNLGSAPNYAQALEPSENHWAMTHGVNE